MAFHSELPVGRRLTAALGAAVVGVALLALGSHFGGGEAEEKRPAGSWPAADPDAGAVVDGVAPAAGVGRL